MTDCPNADIRDQLADLLHDRLDASARAAVMAHVDVCADCRGELELLRSLHHLMIARTPPVNVGRIVAALSTRPIARRRGVNWRLAAAVTVLAVGGTSLAIVNRGRVEHRSPTSTGDTTARIASVHQPPMVNPAPRPDSATRVVTPTPATAASA